MVNIVWLRMTNITELINDKHCWCCCRYSTFSWLYWNVHIYHTFLAIYICINIDRCMYNIYLASVSQLNRSIVYLKNADTDDYYIFYICRARAFFHLYILFFANITNNISIAIYIHIICMNVCILISTYNHIISYKNETYRFIKDLLYFVCVVIIIS